MNSTLQVILGLGFVIFIHELGHFLLAKWNDVKVEKFSIGFGPPLIAWRRGVGLRLFASTFNPADPSTSAEGRSDATHSPALSASERTATAGPFTNGGSTVGETEYALSAIPLGGFVKMLGESPDEGAKTTDPRAYPNKSVGARMAIISAGVIMNVIFGLLCFAWAYRNGVLTEPAVIGVVRPAGPAYEAGIRPGDIITGLDGKPSSAEGLTYQGFRPYEFQKLTMRIALSGPDDPIPMEIRRPGVADPITLTVQARLEPGDLKPAIGVGPTSDTRLSRQQPYLAPAGVVGNPPKVPGGMRVTAIAGPDGREEPVETALDIERRLTRFRAEPIRLSLVPAPPEPGEDTTTAATPETPGTVTIPPVRVMDLGLRMTHGAVVSLRADSPAKEAGFRVGDRIVRIDGRDDFDPVRLPDFFERKAGSPVEVVVRRSLPGRPQKIEAVLTVTPVSEPLTDPLINGHLVEIPSIGLVLPVENTVAAVVAGSPAAQAGIAAGNVITAIEFKDYLTGDATPGNYRTVATNREPLRWVQAWAYLQLQPAVDVVLKVEGRAQPVHLTPVPVEDGFVTSRGLNFASLVVSLPPQSPLAAIRRGIDETIENAVQIYSTIKGLITARISRKLLSGPIGIFRIGRQAARANSTELIRFLGLLSINLAVLNFLPIPPLDGGQMLFLIAEKIRGRPLPESALVGATYFGLILVLGLAVLVLYQDIANLLQSPL